MIANHALYFADLAAGGGVLPEHDAVVFDEAHRLEETAASWLGGRVSRAGLRRLAPTSSAPAARLRRRFRRAPLDRVERAGERLLRAVAPPSGRRRLRETPVERRALLVDALARSPRSSHGRGEELDLLARRALAIAAQVEACLDPASSSGSSGPSPTRVAWAPVDVSGELRERLWDEGPTAILVSATLTTGEDAAFVRSRLGLDRARELVVGSPFDFREQALLYVPRTMPDPRSEGSPSVSPTRSSRCSRFREDARSC